MRKRRTKKEEPKELVVACPVKRHKHNLKLEADPDRPDMIVGYCGDNIVYRAPIPQDFDQGQFTNANVYVVPNFDFEDEGE